MYGKGVLLERMEAGTGGAMAVELGLVDCKLTLAQVNRQAIDMVHLQEVLELLNMRS